MTHIIWFLLIGLCAGWLAGQYTQRRGFGPAGNVIIGIIGAVIGGFLFSLIGLQSTTLLGELITATVGAVAMLSVVQYAGIKRRAR